jgi:hypothetical protein
MGEWMYRTTFSSPRHWLEVSSQLHAPSSLPPEKNPPVPIGEEADGPQNRSGRRWEEKILDPTGTRIPTPQSSSPLYRLRYPGSSIDICEVGSYLQIVRSAGEFISKLFSAKIKIKKPAWISEITYTQLLRHCSNCKYLNGNSEKSQL